MAKSLFFTGIIACMFFAAASCRKHDYRDDYTGNFRFHAISHYFSMLDSTNVWDTTDYSGTIAKAEAEDAIRVTYDAGKSVVLSLDSKGNFTSASGGFSDANHMHSYAYSGGQGGGSSLELIGTRN